MFTVHTYTQTLTEGVLNLINCAKFLLSLFPLFVTVLYIWWRWHRISIAPKSNKYFGCRMKLKHFKSAALTGSYENTSEHKRAISHSLLKCYCVLYISPRKNTTKRGAYIVRGKKRLLIRASFEVAVIVCTPKTTLKINLNERGNVWKAADKSEITESKNESDETWVWEVVAEWEHSCTFT